MIFDELDKKMRVYEQSIDRIIAPGEYMVARLDGNRFTRLTKEICRFEAPFDVKFRDYMVSTVISLMNYGFRIVYGFTESDEISLLFHKDENTFGRKVRKYNSLLSGVASSAFSMELGRQAVFDCRMIPLPNKELVADYFRWRQEDAHRNSLNSQCYWMLRKKGASVAEATNMLKGKTVSFKNELLFQNGINYDKLPAWHKRGIGIYWDSVEKAGYNPVKASFEKTERRILKVDYELPLNNEYAAFVQSFIC